YLPSLAQPPFPTRRSSDLGFCTILRRAHQFIQITSQDLGLRVAEELFKGRVAGCNIAIEVSASHRDRANVHQGLKILLLIVDFQIGRASCRERVEISVVER